MPTAKKVDQIRAQLEQLRKDALDTVLEANRITYKGVQRIADRELTALNETYRAAIEILQKARRTDSAEVSAGKALDVLQEAATRLIDSARDAIAIIAETRSELNKLLQDGVKGQKMNAARTRRATKRTRKSLSAVREPTVKANARSESKRTVPVTGRSMMRANSSGKSTRNNPASAAFGKDTGSGPKKQKIARKVANQRKTRNRRTSDRKVTQSSATTKADWQDNRNLVAPLPSISNIRDEGAPHLPADGRESDTTGHQ